MSGPFSAASAVFAALATLATAAVAAATSAPTAPRLFVLDCGRITLPDMGMFSDTGEYDGKSGTLVTPCFLVMHPKGTLLWDTGLADSLAGKGPISVDGGAKLEVDRGLMQQLEALGVRRVDYLAFSHFHFDHTGNAKEFRNATWLLNGSEVRASLDHPSPFVNLSDVQPNGNRHQTIDGDHDVFGDGAVKILSAPGHTAGHQVLQINLTNTGPVILSGDLYHTRDNRTYQRVPGFNVSRADTLASMNRIETLARNLGARVIIQHDPEDFAALPKAPSYLD